MTRRRKVQAPRVVITCEHAGAETPAEYRGVAPAGMLRTHRAYDRGALELAVSLAGALGERVASGRVRPTPLFVNTVTRLLIDLNRSETNPGVWSRYSAELTERQRRALLTQVYRPFRAAVAGRIARDLRAGPVVHLSVHSFTPVLRGERRPTDIGLLFDPEREAERGLCRTWQKELRRAKPRWRIDLNRPYRGTDDGHTTALRGRFLRGYAGVELEINQRLIRRGRGAEAALHALVIETFARAIGAVGKGE